MWVLLFVVLWFGFAFGFWFVSCSLCLLACLSSFTDWCIAHKQQSREQKKEGRQSGRPTFFGRPTNASGGQQAVRPHRGKSGFAVLLSPGFQKPLPTASKGFCNAKFHVIVIHIVQELCSCGNLTICSCLRLVDLILGVLHDKQMTLKK